MNSKLRDRRNGTIHRLFLKRDFEGCLSQVEETLREGPNEQALYTKALVYREQGKLVESLSLFQSVAAMNPHSFRTIKQIGRSLFLLGRHQQALDVYAEAMTILDDDWESLHYSGICCQHMGNLDSAEEYFVRANLSAKHESTFLALARLYIQKDSADQAVETLTEALEFAPESPEILTALGLVYLRLNQSDKAFSHLGQALTIDPRHPRAILGAGSVLQDHQESDVALHKYRILAAAWPSNFEDRKPVSTLAGSSGHAENLDELLSSLNSGANYAMSCQLWNNIGMAFFSKQNYVAAIACLKRALLFSPLEWIISFNLGLLYLNTSQFCSAFHYLSATINQKPDYAPAFSYLALALSRLDDMQNAVAAYERCVSLDPNNLPALHNFCCFLYNLDREADAREYFGRFESAWNSLDSDHRKQHMIDWEAKRKELAGLLGKKR
eukprot:ANDGO_05277.mRNA.1 Bardet-Biedl syndrome 4 protein homolog